MAFDSSATTEVTLPPYSQRTMGSLDGVVNWVDWDERWHFGVNVVPRNCDQPHLHPVELCTTCNGEPFEPFKTPPECICFAPGQMYDGEHCTTLNKPYEFLKERVDNRLERFMVGKLMEHLHDCETDNDPCYNLANNDQASYAPGSVLSIQDALFFVEQELAASIGEADGLILVSRPMLGRMKELLCMVDGQWRTASGHYVAGPAGFKGLKGPDGAPLTGCNTEFITGLGGLSASISDVFAPSNTGQPGRGLEPLGNDEMYVAKRSFVGWFDPCSQVTIEACLPCEPCPEEA